MIKEKKIVSVIIPTHNRKTLIRALESVLDQDYPLIEIIIVDDNSNSPEYREYTKQILSKYANYSNIIVLYNAQSLGGALSRNEGINVSKGDYIAFLDDDDWYLPSKISKQVDLLDHSNADLAYCWSRGENSQGDIVWENTYSKEGILLLEAMTRCIASTSLIMCKRESLYKVGLFENTPCKQDVLLELKMAAEDCHFVCEKEVLVVYGDAESKVSRISNLSEKTIIGFNKVRDEARKSYTKLTKKQIHFVEADTSEKICLIAKKLGNKKIFYSELKIFLNNSKNIKKTLKLLWHAISWRIR